MPVPADDLHQNVKRKVLLEASKMSRPCARLLILVSVIVFQSGQNSANFGRQPTALPPDPNDQYYETFQNVSSPEVTASKLMTNFLHIHPIADCVRRQQPLYMEDIVIVMDGSGSVQRCEFNKGKNALQHMMRLANERRSDAKYAAVTFASSATVNFKLLPYSSAANNITQIPYPDGMTNTQAGLTEAKKLFDDPSSGRRITATKMVLLVTDGQSNVQTQLTIPRAKVLKHSGVKIFVIAVGTYISGIDEMVKVASYPPERFLFRVKTLQQLWEVMKLVISEVAPGQYTTLLGQDDAPC